MKKLLISALTGISLLALNNSPVIAEELTFVRIDANYPPYEMVVDGKVTGFHIEQVKNVSKRLNHTVKFLSVPWKRAIDMVKTGKADAITYVGKTPEREQYIFYDQRNVLSSSSYGFMILKNRSGELTYNGDLSKLRANKIGILSGYSYGTAFDKADYLKKHAVKNAETLEKLLAVKRIDYAVMDEPKFKQMQNKGKWTNITFLKPVLLTNDFYIAFSKEKGRKKLTMDFANEFEKFRKTKEYNKILIKYGLN